MIYSPLIPELNVSNFAESLRFYVSILGFEVKYQRADPAFAFLELNGAQLMLEVVQEDSWLLAELVKPFGRGMNLSIRCTDVVATATSLDAAGFSFFEPMHEAWYITQGVEYGQRQCIVADPDGYLLRLTQKMGIRPICAS